jgi:hypothetical protein
LTEKVDRLGKDVTKMMDSLDFIVGALQDRRQEEAAGTVWLQRHDKQIADHEGRIRTLETAAR